MMQKYYSFMQFLDMMDEPNKSLCKKMYNDNKALFDSSKGSKTKHQYWQGGYMGHITEVFNIAYRLYADLSNCRSLPFSLSDALLVLFIHDLEKPWKYAGTDEQKQELEQFSDYQEFIKRKIDEYGLVLTKEHYNALKYVHGEGDDYDPYKRIQKPLAAFVHVCDTISARIWYDYPSDSDKW